jgi:ABC-type proline/glycine betaine transport system permease subunit
MAITGFQSRLAAALLMFGATALASVAGGSLGSIELQGTGQTKFTVNLAGASSKTILSLPPSIKDSRLPN